jgi:hypothetical protein
MIETGMATNAATTNGMNGSRGENMRYALVLLLAVLCTASSAAAQVSIGIGLPGVSIGINLPSYPELVVVPDYPVYYAPRADVNLFFYDGLYWAYQRDSWYASSWYNGPWQLVGPEGVPAFVLRIPLRYYRYPPASWAGWRSDAPPRWGERWGPAWEQRRHGWDQWDRRTAQAPAPLPVYQRQYSGNRYPRVEQQQTLQGERYRYQPQDPLVQQHYQQHGAQPQPGERKQQANQRSSPPPPPQQSAPAVSRSQPPREGGEGVQTPRQQQQQPRPAVVQHEQPAPRAQGPQDRPQGKKQGEADTQPQEQGQERGQSQERGQGQDRGQGQEKGQGHNK